MGDIKKTICDRAWNYPIVNFFNNEVSMCCHATHQKVNEKDIDKHGKDIFTKFEPLMDAKLDLLNGIQTKNCSYCWQLENKDLQSSRHSFEKTQKYFRAQGKSLDNLTDENKQDLINVTSPRLVEISLGNTCDLKCMYCNAIFSSQWAVEDLKFNDVSKNHFDNANNSVLTERMEQLWWEWFNTGIYNDADAIGLIGGEPLIIDKTYEYIQKILEGCKSRTKNWPITISIVTNLNTPEIYFNKLLDLIPDILSNPNVILDLSISAESLGERAEFIRTGLKWSRFEKNLHTLLKIAQENKGKIHFSFMIAINALCVSTFPDFIKWVIQLQQTYNHPINLRGSQVVYPLWLSPTILPEDYAKFIINAKDLVDAHRLSDNEYLYGTWSDYSNQLINVIKGIEDTNKNLDNRKMFAERIDLLTYRRNLNFETTFPEMMDFYNQCKNLI